MINQRTVLANGIHQRIAEAGEGPLVLLLHGFPESWYSYRHQIEALAEAGYHAVAPDMRGYGGTDAPAEIDEYTQLHTAGDIIALAAVLGENRFAVVGHDWGSPVAANVGLFRPDQVRGVALLSVPYFPRGDMDMLSFLVENLGPNNYQVFFQQPGVAEKVLEADVRNTVKALLIGGADGEEVNLDTVDPATFIPDVVDVPLPPWLTDEDIDYYTGEFSRTGYRGGLNWYRNSKLNWELLAPWHAAPLTPPSLYVGGELDAVVNWPGSRDIIANLKSFGMPNLTDTVLIDGCGHWIQQEQPERVNAILIDFLKTLPS